MSMFDKFRNYMLGIEEEQDDSDEQPEKPYVEESRARSERTERRTPDREERLDYTSFNKKRAATDNVLNLHTVDNSESKGKVIITRPQNVADAPNVSDYLKLNMITVINLEGVDRADAQRIADFLGGVAYSLNCSIERISNDIFIIAPTQIGISNELKDEIKTSKSTSVPWISAFR